MRQAVAVTSSFAGSLPFTSMLLQVCHINNSDILVCYDIPTL